MNRLKRTSINITHTGISGQVDMAFFCYSMESSTIDGLFNIGLVGYGNISFIGRANLVHTIVQSLSRSKDSASLYVEHQAVGIIVNPVVVV